MRIRALVAAVAIVVALAATACSGSGSEGADDATTTSEATTTTIAVEVPDDAVATDQITITDEGFDPPVVVVEAGATVGWSNQGTSPHTATAEEGAFDTGAIGPGDALAITVDEPGIHTYRCDLHPDLTATLVVTPEPVAGALGAARSLAAVIAAVSIASAGTGCGILGDDAAAPDTEPAPTEATTTTVMPAGEPTLLDPGAEPRTELRLELAPGTETTLAVTTDLAITQTGGDGRRQRLDSPPITQWITYAITDLGPDGAEVDLEVVAAFAQAEGTGLAPEAVADLDEALAGIVGTTGGATITDRGRVERATFDVPDDAPSAVVDQLDAVEAQVAALGPPLPTEPVGVGARWEARAAMPLQGATVRTTTTYTLTSLDGGAVAYEAEIRLEAGAQDLAIAGLDEGTTARLASTSGAGTATGVQQLGDLGLELTARTETDQEVELTGADGTASLAQEITTATSVRTPDP